MSRGVARLLPSPIKKMVKGQKGMLIDHPGAGVSHHVTDPFSHSWLVAMKRTPGALRFSFLIRTTQEPFPGIIKEIITIPAKRIISIVP